MSKPAGCDPTTTESQREAALAHAATGDATATVSYQIRGGVGVSNAASTRNHVASATAMHFHGSPISSRVGSDILSTTAATAITSMHPHGGRIGSDVLSTAAARTAPLPPGQTLSAVSRGAPSSSRTMPSPPWQRLLLILMPLLALTAYIHGGPAVGRVQPPSTLVMYIFSDSDPEAINNLRYFVSGRGRAGEGDGRAVVTSSPTCATLWAGRMDDGCAASTNILPPYSFPHSPPMLPSPLAGAGRHGGE